MFLERGRACGAQLEESVCDVAAWISKNVQRDDVPKIHVACGRGGRETTNDQQQIN